VFQTFLKKTKKKYCTPKKYTYVYYKFLTKSRCYAYYVLG